MTPEQVTLIRTSWRQVIPVAATAAGLFYEQLFALDPTLRPLFAHADMEQQGKKLLQALGTVVASADRLHTLGPALEDLGRKHLAYSVAERTGSRSFSFDPIMSHEECMNNIKTMVLMAGLMGLFLLAGQLLGGSQGLVFALVLGGAFNFVMYFFSATMVLRMYRAQIVTEEQAPELYRMVDRLRQRAGLPMPVIAVAPHEQPNAFATGRNPEHAVVAVTTGILKYMPQEELEGVLAHELAHVKNRDMLITTLAAGIAGAISNLPYLIMFGGGREEEGGHPFAQLA